MSLALDRAQCSPLSAGQEDLCSLNTGHLVTAPAPLPEYAAWVLVHTPAQDMDGVGSLCAFLKAVTFACCHLHFCVTKLLMVGMFYDIV